MHYALRSFVSSVKRYRARFLLNPWTNFNRWIALPGNWGETFALAIFSKSIGHNKVLRLPLGLSRIRGVTAFGAFSFRPKVLYYPMTVIIEIIHCAAKHRAAGHFYDRAA